VQIALGFFWVRPQAGPDLGLVRPQATVIVWPQAPHTPTISIILLTALALFCSLFFNLEGPLNLGAHQALLLLLLCKSATAHKTESKSTRAYCLKCLTIQYWLAAAHFRERYYREAADK